MTQGCSGQGAVSRACFLVAVLEDDTSFREALVSALSSLDYGVMGFEAPNGLLAEVHDLEPDCLIMDFDLPQMTGLEVLHRLEERGIVIPAIMVTANRDRHIRSRIAASSAVACLDKPVSIEEVDGLILSLLGRKPGL